MKETRNLYRVFVRMSLAERLPRRSRWKDSAKMYIVNWTELPLDWVQWQIILVSGVLNLRVYYQGVIY